MLKQSCVYIILLWGMAVYAEAQHTLITGIQDRAAAADTVPEIRFDTVSLNQLNDIRKQFVKQNSTYSIPTRPSSDLLRFLQKDELKLSPEALYWARKVMDASTLFSENMTFKDTVIPDPMLMPAIFRGKVITDETLPPLQPVVKESSPYDFLYQPDTTMFRKYKLRKKLIDEAYANVEKTNITAFRYSVLDLPGETIRPRVIARPHLENVRLNIRSDVSFDDVEAPAKFIPDRQYWTSAFESAIQFSQNYVSKNWYNGGYSNINIFSKHYMRYDYNRDKVKITNELEIRASLYNAPKDTLRNYKVSDDVFRVRSNVGYQAFNKWYYTFDALFETQLFQNFQENSRIKSAALLSPFTITIGVGMKYDLDKKFTQRNKNLKLTVNLAPLSYKYKYSIDHGVNMDLGRHGFKLKNNPVEGENPYRHSLSSVGSNIQVDMTMNFNRNVSWQSRLLYFTTYDHVVSEFENTLTLAINRYFSTRIYLNVRHDDTVTKTPGFDSYFQINQLLSFGFNYKW